MGRPPYSLSILKILFASSQNRCAYPNCGKSLTGTVEGVDFFFGEICHIEGVNKKAARHNPNREREHLNDLDNLVLMCHDHHKVIDALPEKFTVERLRQIKKEHELQGLTEVSQSEAYWGEVLYAQEEKKKPVRVYNNSPHIENVAKDNARQTVNIKQTINYNGRRKEPTVEPTEGVIGADASKRSYIGYLYGKLVEYLAGMPNYTGARAGVTAARKVRKRFCAKWSTVPLERYDELAAFLKAEIDKTVAGRAMRKVGLNAYKTEREFLGGQKANSGI